ncbi:MAG: MAPEG family protein [Gammaproteobacteria bacterium]|nr:MAPEG family protein [Gammaproteobacteria bacterium]MBT8109777.1 MAPEG family protein [Gammaproteobacteria bacterium]NNL44479.1 hypothetical protein [Woeseiaceae bacterium]
MLIVTAIAASALGLLYVRLSLNVIGFRRKHGVSVGDGGHEDLLRAIRSQGNLAEYAPIALLLVACLELNQTPMWITSILAASFVVGRLLHPIGMKSADSPLQPRLRGMQLTLLSLLALCIANLVVVGWSVFIL